ncbi:MAG: hypothetical protein JWN38_381 [Candidatus Saccharibacteria bacterium]|nr:hypothetical protein [Candidatus Saccharibacteria bacterium]
MCGCGGIGRHASFRSWCRKVWRFKSSHPHQRKDPRMGIFSFGSGERTQNLASERSEREGLGATPRATACSEHGAADKGRSPLVLSLSAGKLLSPIRVLCYELGVLRTTAIGIS